MANDSPADTVLEIALGDLGAEIGQTRRILERVPAEHFGWRPHDKSMSLGQLATHIAMLPRFALAITRTSEFDYATTEAPSESQLTSRDAVLRAFDDGAVELKAALASMPDEQLRATWTLRSGDATYFAGTRTAAIRALVLSHLFHHRGQLSVYLRLLGIAVPGLYGQSADEKGT